MLALEYTLSAGVWLLVWALVPAVRGFNWWRASPQPWFHVEHPLTASERWW